MPRRSDPWKWPVSGLAALLMLVGLFLIPHAWIQAFFSPLGLSADEVAHRDRPVLVILPPLEVDVTPEEVSPPKPDPRPKRLAAEDPRWWTDGWRVRSDFENVMTTTGSVADSTRFVLEALGLGADLMSRVKPDSVLANRLAILRHEDSFRFDELKPYLSAMAKARDYADIMSRAADMYGEHLQSEIMVPDCADMAAGLDTCAGRKS